jgi:pimeloyl-ACP methyl ester carboxylesterase
VLAPLRDAGREVHAVTLTGDGERAHLRHAGIDLFTHIDDVLGLIDAEELTDITLVGHSYGGQVITGVADRLLQRQADAAGPRASGRPDPLSSGGPGGPSNSGSGSTAAHAVVRQLVYIDAMVPVPGEGWGDQHAPEVVAARQQAARLHDNALPPPDPRDFGIEGADRDWLLRRHVLHPFGAYRQPLPFDGPLWAAVPRCFVDCTQPAYPTIDGARRRVRSQGGWRIVEMPTGHFPMVTRPDELTRLLLELS